MLPVAGGEVTQVRIDYAFGLIIETYDERRASTSIRIGSPFEYVQDGVTLRVDPEQTEQLAPLLTLHKAGVNEGFAIKDGNLVLRFDGGREIRVAPNEQYEAWEASGHLAPIERKFSLVAVPSGGVALF